jgi:hypothetical protein
MDAGRIVSRSLPSQRPLTTIDGLFQPFATLSSNHPRSVDTLGPGWLWPSLCRRPEALSPLMPLVRGLELAMRSRGQRQRQAFVRGGQAGVDSTQVKGAGAGWMKPCMLYMRILHGFTQRTILAWRGMSCRSPIHSTSKRPFQSHSRQCTWWVLATHLALNHLGDVLNGKTR